MDELVFFVNGLKVAVNNPNPRALLLHFIRKELRLTGTKISCGQGGCGSCTIIISRYHRQSGTTKHVAVSGCLVPLCWVHGAAVTTIEGLGSVDEGMHPLQKSIADHHGSQCGFCTPGMIMSMCGLVCADKKPTDKDIEDTISGNLCRCTGYRSIQKAFTIYSLNNKGDSTNPVMPHIFPEELKTIDTHTSHKFDSSDMTWFNIYSLEHLLELKSKFPSAVVVQGCTGIRKVMERRGDADIVLNASQVPELGVMRCGDDGLIVGAGVTVESFLEYLQGQKGGMAKSMAEMLQKSYASKQIRNIATIGGGFAKNSGKSDIMVLLAALGGRITLIATDKSTRDIVVDETFASNTESYIQRNEIIKSIVFPNASKNDAYFMCKPTHRPGTDGHLTLAVKVTTDNQIINRVNVALGNVAPTVVRASHTEGALVGRNLSEVVESVLRENITRDICGYGSNPSRRQRFQVKTATNLITSFFISIQQPADAVIKETAVPESPSAVHVYEEVPPGQSVDDAVGRPIVHGSAYEQATGEVDFMDDIPERKGELHLALIKSEKAHATILDVDTAEALKIPGVVGYIDQSSIPGPYKGFFAVNDAGYFGHPIGAIAAESREIAKLAAKKVKVRYDEHQPILSIEQALEVESMYDWQQSLQEGDVEAGLSAANHVVEGVVRLGGQEHYYLETQGCLVVPSDGKKELDIICCSQYASLLQTLVCLGLGLQANKVNVRVKRTGGAFGGKGPDITSPLALACSAVALKYRRPVRLVLDRDEDLAITGTRPSYLLKYKAGLMASGKLNALKLDWYGNAGYGDPLETIIMMSVGLIHLDNCYRIPHFLAKARICKTNVAQRVPMRGYGSIEALYLMEAIMTELAESLNISQEQIREVNMFEEGNRPVGGGIIQGFSARTCWDKVIEDSEYYIRKTLVDQFNRANKTKKRGIFACPLRKSSGFGTLSSFARALCQATAVVNIYQDGTVLLSHQGMEMGQGIHTKMIQVASRALGVPVSEIYISETSTSSLANGSPTGATTASDLNGRAIMDACETINSRLKPIREKNPDMSWEKLIQAAYFERVSLTATGFFKQAEDDLFDWDKKTKNPFPYYVHGAGVTEVEVDCLTGQHKVLRADMVIDLGKSLNPAIDIGQIEGGYVQYYGNLTSEELLYTSEGRPVFTGPGSYVIPGISNIPHHMRVTLLKDGPDCGYDQSVYSSKGVGEPPMAFAVSAFLAIKMAVKAAREEEEGRQRTDKCDNRLRFDAPATMMKILEACSREKETEENPLDDFEI